MVCYQHFMKVTTAANGIWVANYFTDVQFCSCAIFNSLSISNLLNPLESCLWFFFLCAPLINFRIVFVMCARMLPTVMKTNNEIYFSFSILMPQNMTIQLKNFIITERLREKALHSEKVGLHQFYMAIDKLFFRLQHTNTTEAYWLGVTQFPLAKFEAAY